MNGSYYALLIYVYIHINEHIYIYIYIYICCVLKCSVVSDSFDPMDCSLPGSSVHGILLTRILEWVAILPSPVIKYEMSAVKSLSRV